MNIDEKYETIIMAICEVEGISKHELFKVLKDNNCRYLLFLLMQKYKCSNSVKLKDELKANNENVGNIQYKKAKERFLINKNFRDAYFEIDEIVEKTLDVKKKTI